MRIGLTGARGVLGSRIGAALMKTGHDLVQFKGDVGSVRDVEAWTDGLDAAVHAAAIVPVDQVANQLSNAIAVNVIGSANVAKAIAKNPACHLTYISSSHVYASSIRPLSEADVTIPTSMYGLTKLQGEHWTSLLHNRSLIVRVFSYFDERQPVSYLIPSLRSRIMEAPKNAKIRLQGAANTRDIVTASWVAEVCSHLIGKMQTGLTNCGSGIGITVNDVAQRLSAASGRDDISWIIEPSEKSNSLVACIDHLVSRIGPLPFFKIEDALDRYAKKVG